MSLPVSRDMVLDPGTFGNSPACHVLVNMMNEGLIPIRAKHKILSMLNDVANSAKYLMDIPHDGVRNQAILLSREHYCSKVDMMSYHPKFKSHLKNVIHHFYNRNVERKMRVDRAIAATYTS